MNEETDIQRAEFAGGVFNTATDAETNELRDQGLIPPALSDLTEMEVLDLENILTQFKAAINDLNQRVTHLEKTY